MSKPVIDNSLLMTGRLAFREDGSTWGAYYAAPDTMLGAV